MADYWFEIVRTRRGYKPRLRSANFRTTWVAEHYSSRGQATKAIERLATLFYRAADSWPEDRPEMIRTPGRNIPIVDIDRRVLGR